MFYQEISYISAVSKRLLTLFSPVCMSLSVSVSVTVAAVINKLLFEFRWWNVDYIRRSQSEMHRYRYVYTFVACYWAYEVISCLNVLIAQLKHGQLWRVHRDILLVFLQVTATVTSNLSLPLSLSRPHTMKFHLICLVFLFLTVHPVFSGHLFLLTSCRSCTNLIFGSRSFNAAAPTVWNSLPDSIRSSNTLNYFRHHLKTHNFQAAFNTP